jgi:hypothetical protein
MIIASSQIVDLICNQLTEKLCTTVRRGGAVNDRKMLTHPYKKNNTLEAEYCASMYL